MCRFWVLVLILLLLPDPAFAADITVTQSHMAFDADHITIHSGDTIVFKNKDNFPHDIQIGDMYDEAVDLGFQQPNIDYRYRFHEAGTYTIRCSLHKMMKLTIRVE